MFNTLRLFVITVFTQAGYLYATWLVLRQGKHASPTSPPPGIGGTSSSSPSQTSPKVNSVHFDTASLKLCIMMTAAAAATSLGADAFPLFPESRVIVMYLLLFAPTSTQEEIYDKAFSPLLVKCGSLARSLQSSDFLTKRVCLFVVRKLVTLCVIIMNYVDRCGTLEPDAIKDILGGLVFSRRALNDVAAQQRERTSASPTFLGSLVSNFSTNNGGAALRDFAASLASQTESDGLTRTTKGEGPSLASTDRDATWGLQGSPAESAFSAYEEVRGSPRDHHKKKR